MPLTLVVVMALLLPTTMLAKGPGGGETTVGNNLSYPAITADGYAITPVTDSFTVTYPVDATDTYSGLTADEIAWLEANGPWYPQKTTGNTWQADYVDAVAAVDVDFIDWGDNVETVSPKLRSPFRLEVTLYEPLADLGASANGYTMRVLEYPSSSNELQGTNNVKYDADYATVVSASPKLVVQFLGASVPTNLEWASDKWVYSGTNTWPSIAPVSFAPELNVGGKYVWGASQGGWKPTQAGYYRITFFAPLAGEVQLNGMIANASTGFTAPAEGKAVAVLVPALNLTYIDVLALAGGGGGGKRP
jgi:hypothetical protein